MEEEVKSMCKKLGAINIKLQGRTVPERRVEKSSCKPFTDGIKAREEPRKKREQ